MFRLVQRPLLSDFLSVSWRKRVRVELTTRLAKSRIAGFEGREGHRTPCASAIILQNSPRVRNFLCATPLAAMFFRLRLPASLAL